MPQPLTLSFSPSTIDALGIKMYSRLPYALAEIVANAYDANAKNVSIKLYDNDPQNKYIIVSDDGIGMSYDEINNKFLVIGRHRRETGEARDINGRKITGKKGLGKLALFGIGKVIYIETTSAGEANYTNFCLDWDAIINTHDGTYNPKTEFKQKTNNAISGTTITLKKLTRETNFNLLDTAISLSKMFNILGDEFQVRISKNDNEEILLTKELKYQNIDAQKEWDFTNDILPNIDDEYEFKNLLTGKIIATPKPMPADLRGITLYANGRLINTPGFFGVSEAGHAFTYLTGYINADFIDEFDEDLISTDRQSLSWELPQAEKLQKYLQKVMKFLVKDWSVMRKQKKQEKVIERTGVNINDWLAKVPNELKDKIQDIITETGERPEVNDEDFTNTVKNLHILLPEYTYFHYRQLHEYIKAASEHEYKTGNYYAALLEASKQYSEAIKNKIQSLNLNEAIPDNIPDRNLMGMAFGQKDTKLLKVFENARKTNGGRFEPSLIGDLEDAQQLLSMGIIAGYRNPIAHIIRKELQDTGVLTEQHCLDALSLLSSLFSRLDNAVATPTQEPKAD